MKGQKAQISTARGRDIFEKYRKIISILVKVITLVPLNRRKKILVRLKNKSGKIAIGLRYVLLKSLVKKCGENVSIDEGVFLLNPEMLTLGNNISVNPFCYLQARGGITICDNVSIGHFTTIMSSDHIYDDLNIPIKDQGVQVKPVCIGEGAWIGAKVTILMGVTIGKGAIVGAGAVVTKDVGEFEIVGGIPAHLIGQRR